ncbi:hypothetical protein KFL_000300290 [Klebsormidium nitens]|uniref:Macro domain-containing protein n=1 Tax=Klebsormidium nitens TaxID=105231 RepID=A0A0U9HIA1_KLENI|nr:hypothetical protein KFL_000300290 [Klebsormidium nitens]|eukprot:GAQ79431.1 hypothetical protein KFL_000300290 [Klebsormidium nitens]
MSVVHTCGLRSGFSSLALQAGLYRPGGTISGLTNLPQEWLLFGAFDPKAPALTPRFERPHFDSLRLGARLARSWHRMFNKGQTRLDSMFFGGDSFGGRSYSSRSQYREPEVPPPSQWYKLSQDCLLALHKGDITTWFVDMKTDAIVNAANRAMLGGAGVDGAIHRAAGEDLYYACKAIQPVEPGVRCPTGEARITEGFRLPARAVIHTVGPIYEGKEESEPLLAASYRNSILLAADKGIQYLSFPAISCGVYGYPYDEGARVALTTCRDNADKLKEIHFILFEQPAWLAWRKAARDLGLPLIEIDEEARKASQEQAREERRAKLREERERERAARGGRSPEDPTPRRGVWGMGGRSGGDEGGGRSRKEGRSGGERGYGSFLGGNAGRGVGGLMDLVGNAGTKKDDGAYNGWKTGKAGAGFGDSAAEKEKGGPEEDAEMQDSDSARGAAWDMATGWGSGGTDSGAPQTEVGDKKDERAPSWLAGGEKESEEEEKSEVEEGSEAQGKSAEEGAEGAWDEKQESDGAPMKKVFSSSGSFRTGQEDFEGEESQEEEVEGKTMKRARSEDEYKDAQTEVWDSQDRRNKKSEAVPTSGLAEVAEKRSLSLREQQEWSRRKEI